MAGHSKWANIRFRKGAQDAKRGKIFTKISKELTVAARLGGGDPAANPRLRLAMEKARSVNMPADNVKRAIQKGTGELPGVAYEEVSYEGYGPAGVALLIEALTDNRNRTVAEIRHILGKHGGNLGENGCVAWIFETKGYILVDRKKTDEDTLMGAALDAGAEDLRTEDAENFEVLTDPADFEAVKEALGKAGIEPVSAEVTKLPKTEVRIEGEKEASQMIRLMEALEEHDDIQNVYANFDIPDALMAKLA